MKIAAVIAEFNPFHNGHRYLVQTLKKQTDADYLVAVMSGDFVQRGAPALLDKYTRANMALQAGVDLVLELPAVYALSAADQFALGGVKILDALGCNVLGFGCEDDDLERLSEAAALFEEEPDDFWEALSAALREGLSYPAAREQAACRCLTQRAPEIFPTEESVQELLSGPNNTLAISYLQAIRRLHSPMTPVPIARIGSAHGDDLLPSSAGDPEKPAAQGASPILRAEEGIIPGTIRSSGKGQVAGHVAPRLYASAGAIRAVMHDCAATHRFLSAYPALKQSVPGQVYDVLSGTKGGLSCQFEDDYTVMLRYALLKQDKDSLLSYCGQNESFANRLLHHRDGWQSVTELTELLKHKSRTYTGISRTLFRILLGIDEATGAAAAAEPAYARVLGMRQEASEILSAWRQADDLPVIVRLAEDSSILSEPQRRMLKLDLFAADLYESVQELKTGEAAESEYARRLLTV